MKTMKLIVLLIFTAMAHGQSKRAMVRQDTNLLFQNIVRGEAISEVSNDTLLQYGDEVSKVAMGFSEHPVEKVRFQAYELLYRRGLLSEDPRVRQQTTALIARGCEDANPLVYGQNRKFLLGFAQKDFSPETSQRIYKQFLANHDQRLIRMMGILGITEAMPQLKSLSTTQNFGHTHYYMGKSWHASLAAARMGDVEALETVREGFAQRQHAPLSTLLRDLAYVNKPATLSILKKFLESQDVEEGNNDVVGVYHKQLALNALATQVPNFPVSASPSGQYSPQEIQAAIDWFNN